MRLRWSRLREGTAASAEPQLQRGGTEPPVQDADGDTDNDGTFKDCPDCENGWRSDGSLCTTCEGAGLLPMRESELTTAARKEIDKSQFAIPEKAPGSGSYPIQDLKHGENALARSKGKPEEGRVKAAVYKKYPQLKESADPLQERNSELESLLASTTERLRESSSGEDLAKTFAPISATDGGYEVVLIREGLGNNDDSRWYTRHAVQELVSSGVCEGMQAYADHPSLDEEEFLPERSVRDMVGSYTGVRLAESATGLSEARAVFKPVKGKGYEWVESLAEAAVGNRTGKPLVGISLYGAAAGDERERPDGSFGPMADLIRPTSGDIVTNAGAGGEFVRRLMESARAKRASNNDTKGRAMTLEELQAKMKESAKKLREAGTDEERKTATDELDTLAKAEVTAPEPTLDGLTEEKLKESQPTLYQKIRESAKGEVKIPATAPEADASLKAENEQLAQKLRESEGRVAEKDKTIAETNGALVGIKVMREAKIPAEDAEYFLGKFREAGASTEDAMKAVIEAEQKREERIVARVRESAGLDFIEGMPGHTTGGTSDGLLDLSEDGLPMVEPEKAAA